MSRPWENLCYRWFIRKDTLKPDKVFTMTKLHATALIRNKTIDALVGPKESTFVINFNDCETELLRFVIRSQGLYLFLNLVDFSVLKLERSVDNDTRKVLRLR